MRRRKVKSTTSTTARDAPPQKLRRTTRASVQSADVAVQSADVEQVSREMLNTLYS